MRRNKSRLIILLFSLISIFILLLLKTNLTGFFPETSTPAFVGLDRNKIHRIKITDDKITELHKKSKDWYTKTNNTRFKADSTKVNQIIDGFINLKKENIVSSNSNRHRDLGINRRKIELTADGKSYVLYIGNAEGLSNNYVRIDKENEVFVATGFAEIFTSNDYRDLSLNLISNENKVSDITINHSGISLKLAKNKKGWKVNERVAKRDRVDFYLSDLKMLKAQDILKKKENYSYIDPELIITLKENNKQKIISFYQENEDSYLTTVSSSGYGYIVPIAYVASLKKEEKDFIE